MNLSAALVPQGSLSGLSNVFPKRISSALYLRRKRPIVIEFDLASRN